MKDTRYLRYLVRRPPTGPGIIHGIVTHAPGEEPCDDTCFRAQLWDAAQPDVDCGYDLPLDHLHKAQRSRLQSGMFLWFRQDGKGKAHLIDWRPRTKREQAAYERRVKQMARRLMTVL